MQLTVTNFPEPAGLYHSLQNIDRDPLPCNVHHRAGVVARRPILDGETREKPSPILAVQSLQQRGGAFAGRLWWLLRSLGHDHVAVLNGGIQQWQRRGYALTTTLPQPKTSIYRPYLNTDNWLTASQVENRLAQKSICLIDARTPERYRGEQEPIDPVAGHIPGALNRPFQLNLNKQGLFLPPEQLAQQFSQLIGSHKPEQVVHYCGSGVTACHNLLAMEHAGLQGSKLYAGAWSEWIRDKSRGLAKN